jgi:capsular exopolysaccharide synthesis family protein
MLHFTAPDGLIEKTAPAAHQPAGLELGASLRSGWWIVLACLLAGIGGAGAIVATSEATYITSARVLFDPRRADTNRQMPEREQPQYAIDSAQLESQIQLLKSEQISRPVIEAHGIETDAEFFKARFSLRAVLRPFLAPEAKPRSDTYNVASAEFDSRLDVRRVGQSYVLQISFQSADPLKAAKLTNSVTAAYIARQLTSRIENVQRNSQFERPIRELTAEGTAATTAVKTGVINIDTFPAADARVISAALTPSGPSTPRTSLIMAFGAALGLLGGGALAVARHNLRRPVLTREHVERQLGLNYFGTLRKQGPHWRSWSRRGPHIIDVWGIHLMLQAPPIAAATELRTIRTSFEMSVGQRDGQCVGVTSHNVGEGKTLTAQGLALAFAAAGCKTLLIDANPLNPTLSSLLPTDLRVRPTTGFAQVLGGDNLTNAICATRAGNLSFMAIGQDIDTANFSDRFDTGVAKDIFRQLRERFDRIVIDLPDFSTVPDAWAIGAVVDSYVLVIAAGRTSQLDVARMVAALRCANAGVAGVVLNEGGA